VFTSERNGDGNSDLFRCRPDGTGIEPLVTGPSADRPSSIHRRVRKPALRPTRRIELAHQLWENRQTDVQADGVNHLHAVYRDPTNASGTAWVD
jgi:hypothetical protein